MPVFALYNFDDADTVARDSALGNGAQDGLYLNGAAASGGQAVLDGENDLIKLYPNPTFQMDRGTLDISFALGQDPLTGTQTILSRDSAGTTDGGYRIEILADGSVVISHETPTGVETFGTAPGFANPGDAINLSYSWDQGGDGGVLVIENTTSGDTFNEAVPNTLTMDMSGQGINQPWIIGAGQASSDPGMLNNIDQHFQGTVTMFQLSDTVDNNDGRDGIVRGTTGNDVIDYSYIDPTDGDRVDANDALIPGDGPNDDRVEAGDGDDSAIGGNGNDTVNGGIGNDTLLGDGPGVADSYDRAYPGDYTADVNPNNNRDLLTGGAGNDSMEGGDDADTLYGGAGVDIVIGGIDDDLIYGGAAPGETGGFDGSDSLIGGQGRDTIFGGVGNDNITGDDGADGTHNAPDDGTDLDTENNRDLLNGGEGDDLILGGDDDDTLNGDVGNDDLRGGLDDDLLNGGAGNDGLMGETGNDVLNGDAGNDTLFGGAGNDSMTGGADRDVFVGANAGDVVDGSEAGDDFDTLDLRGLGPLSVVYDPANAENGTVTFRDAAGNPTGTMSFVNIENVLTDPAGPDGIVRGTTGADVIDTAYVDPFDTDSVDDNDAILPGDAPNDDRILAGAGNDTVLAGLGDDSVEAGTGDDSVRGGVGDDTVYGQAGDDTILGEDGNDTLTGGLGNDSVNGGDGDDLIDTRGDATPLPDQDYPGIYGADDNPDDDHDTVNGGTGNDTIFTGDDADTITGGFGNDVIDAGFDDDLIEGNQGDDTIIGAEGNDTIDAGLGNDVVYGGYGPGTPDAVNIPDSVDLRPDNGRDSIVGGSGDDTIFGLDDDDTLIGGLDNDVVYGGIDDDLIIGESGNDRLFGDAGNDTVSGGLGNDILTGGAGQDELSGGADRDDFIVGSPTQGAGDTVFGGDGGDDFDRLILTGAAPYRLRDVVTDSDGNGIDGTVEFLDADGNVTGTLTFTNIEEIVPCFTPGTLIATPKGEVPVEHLKAGDRVITRDNGIQEIRWTGQKALGWKDLAANPHLKPVLIRQGSLGNGLPERDMMVSPNHRMLVANDRTALYFDEHEVLVSAKHLVAANGIQSIDSIGTTYIHFMFDRHEVVLGNGAWTESFQPGDMTLKGMGNAQRNEIFELFPELKTEAGLNDYQAARRTLKKHEARLLVK